MGDRKKKIEKIPEMDDRGFLLHMRDLKKAYRQTYWQLRQTLKATGQNGTHPDEAIIKGAISDVHFAIEWMHTGRRPGNKRGIERRAAYQRERLMDPVLMQSFVSNTKAGAPSSLSDWELFQIEDALSRLSPRERECYEMKHGQGFSLDYIAKLLKISKESVQEYVDRAQKKVSEDLQNSLFLI